MDWVTPQFSKSRVNAAGRALIDPNTSKPEHDKALDVLGTWRSSHSFPLNTIQMGLRQRARSTYASALPGASTLASSGCSERGRRVTISSFR